MTRLRHADLHRGKADPVGLVHALDHVVDQPAGGRIDRIDGLETALRRGSGAVRMGRMVMSREIGLERFAVKGTRKNAWN